MEEKLGKYSTFKEIELPRAQDIHNLIDALKPNGIHEVGKVSDQI